MTQTRDLFEQINNAVLDLQASDYQSYGQPLKRLGRLLRHPDLFEINRQLTDGMDLDAFLAQGDESRSSMVGSAQLNWPDDDREVLDLQLMLVLQFCDNPDFMADISHT